MKIKTKRYNFSFHPDVDSLLKKLAEETELTYTKIVERGIKAIAKEKGIVC